MILLKRKMKNFRLNFKRGICNLYLWIPTIWGLHAWDWAFLFEVMHKQIKLMEKSMIDNAFVEGYEEYAEEMRITADAIKRIMDEEYDGGTLQEIDKAIDDDLDIIANAIKTQVRCWWW